MNSRTPFRTMISVGSGFFAVTLLIGCMLWPKQPRFESATVVSGSMAPLLMGPHYEIACSDCRIPFHVSSEQLPEGTPLVCPQCGFRNQPETLILQRGDDVLIERAAYEEADPLRWQLVAFARPDDEAQRTELKRVVGLPGESIAIEDGDIFVEGKRVRSSISQGLAGAVLIHRFEPTSDQGTAPARWRPRPLADTDAALEETKRPTVILDYEHWSCVLSPLPRNKPSPVMDSYGCNQALSRQLNLARDLILECELEMPHGSAAALRLRVLGRSIEGRLDAKTRLATLSIDNQIVASESATKSHGSIILRVASLDGKARFEIDGDQELVADLAEQENWRPETSPASVVLEHMDQSLIERIVLHRDRFYLNPDQMAARWSIDLGDGEYLLLGDNVPVSRDGRHFGPVKRKAILGQVRKAADGLP